jgi:hypothetical protein
MRIVRATLGTVAGVGVGALLSSALLAGGQAMGHEPTKGKSSTTHHTAMGGTMTKEQKIADASTAAPATVSAKATILDWPAKEGEKPPVLRAGTNGWTCFPDAPETDGSDPMCLDQPWLTWIDGYLARTTPQITRVGVGYMIAPGGAKGSNTDPYAMAPTADNHWGLHQPHLMIVVPDLKALEGIPTDPNNGGPYVMWKGTPYAHIMAPVTAPAMSGAMTAK